jgi:hypothetical protein
MKQKGCRGSLFRVVFALLFAPAAVGIAIAIILAIRVLLASG